MPSVDVSMRVVGHSAIFAPESGERLGTVHAGTGQEMDRDTRFPCAGGKVVPPGLEGDAAMSPREAFMQRVRQAVAEGNRPGAAPPLPERSGVGYQGAGADPVERFCKELEAAGGKGYVAADAMAVVHTIQSILQAHN